MGGGSGSVGSRPGAAISDDEIVVESLQDLSKSGSGGYDTLRFGSKRKRGRWNKQSILRDEDIDSDEVLARLRSYRKKKDKKVKKRKAKKANKKAKREEEILEPEKETEEEDQVHEHNPEEEEDAKREEEGALKQGKENIEMQMNEDFPPVQENEEAPPVPPMEEAPNQINRANLVAQLLNHQASQGNEPPAERLRTVEVLIEGLDVEISILQDQLNGLMEERDILVDELGAAAGAGNGAYAGPNVPENGHDGEDGHIDLNVASDDEMLELRL